MNQLERFLHLVGRNVQDDGVLATVRMPEAGIEHRGHSRMSIKVSRQRELRMPVRHRSDTGVRPSAP